MTASLVLTFVWFVAANILALVPTRDNHWRRAYLLIACGVPLVGWVTWQNGPWIGLLVLAAGASILRWPLIYLGRWLRRRVG
jgi:hypothetical protein